MHLNSIKLILTVFVFGFGFISCSQEKTSEKQVIYQQDRFRPDKVSTQNEDKTILDLRDIKTLEAGGLIRFDLLKNHDFKKNSVIFNVESSCRQNNHQNIMYRRVDFKDVAEISVARLLPPEVFASVTEDMAICDFIITATNQAGSTNVNRLSSVEINHLLKYSNFDPEITDVKRAEWEDAKTVPLLIEENTSATLACQDFTQTLSLVKKDLSLSDFQIDNEKILSLLKTPQQTCRVLVYGFNSTQVSKLFTLIFPAQPLIAEARVMALPISSHYKNQDVLHLEFSNPNSFTVKVKIARYTTMRFVLRPVYMFQANALLGRMQRSLIKLVPTTKDHMTINDDMFVTIPPFETATVKAIATRDLICQGGIPSVLDKTAPIGTLVNRSPEWLLAAGANYDYELGKMGFFYETGENQWEEMDLTFQGKVKEIELSDYKYWSLPNQTQIKNAFGTYQDIWSHILETNDVCSD